MTIELDSFGDLVVVAGYCNEAINNTGNDNDANEKLKKYRTTNAPRFLVCSKTLARASPVWRAMLYGPFVERKPEDASKPWIVALPEDDPEALELVLKIAHGVFDVPEELDPDLWKGLLDLSNKYDVFHLLKPWIRDWTKEFYGWYAEEEGSEQLLQYAWAIGDQLMLSKSITYIVRHSELNDQGVLVNDYGTEMDFFMPPSIDILVDITAIREGIVSQLCSVFQKRLNALFDPEARKSVCNMAVVDDFLNKETRSDCAYHSLGCLVYELSKAGYYPLIATNVRCSVVDFSSTLKDIARNLKPTSNVGQFLFDHSGCSASEEILSEIDAILREVPKVNEEKYKERLGLQAIKSGIRKLPM